MDKAEAIAMLGGTVGSAAGMIGVTPSAITQWPAVLPPRLADRVLAALMRQQLQTSVKLTAATRRARPKG